MKAHRIIVFLVLQLIILGSLRAQDKSIGIFTESKSSKMWNAPVYGFHVSKNRVFLLLNYRDTLVNRDWAYNTELYHGDTLALLCFDKVGQLINRKQVNVPDTFSQLKSGLNMQMIGKDGGKDRVVIGLSQKVGVGMEGKDSFDLVLRLFDKELKQYQFKVNQTYSTGFAGLNYSEHGKITMSYHSKYNQFTEEGVFIGDSINYTEATRQSDRYFWFQDSIYTIDVTDQSISVLDSFFKYKYSVLFPFQGRKSFYQSNDYDLSRDDTAMVFQIEVYDTLARWGMPTMTALGKNSLDGKRWWLNQLYIYTPEREACSIERLDASHNGRTITVISTDESHGLDAIGVFGRNGKLLHLNRYEHANRFNGKNNSTLHFTHIQNDPIDNSIWVAGQIDSDNFWYEESVRTAFILHLDSNGNLLSEEPNLVKRDLLSTSVSKLSVDKPGVWPNPAKEYLNFVWKYDVATCAIYDTHGHLIKQISVNNNCVYVGDLSPGYYMIKLADAKDFVSGAGFIKE